MPCSFTNEVSTFTLPTWHEFVSPWDSLDGRSPLMQICRTLNEARAILSATPFDFHRVGTDALDTDLAVIDYELNPSWNPIQDFSTILTQCKSVVYSFANGTYYPNSEDCKNRRYADYLSFPSITGDTTLVENWQPIIVQIREFLALLVGADIQIQDWEPGEVDLYVDSISFVEGNGTYGENDLDALFVRTWDNPIAGDYEVRYGKSGGAAYNKFSDKATICTGKSWYLSSASAQPAHASGRATLIDASKVGTKFLVGLKYIPGVGDNYFPIVLDGGTYLSTRYIAVPDPNDETYYPSGSDFCDQYNSAFGWATVTHTNHTFTISRTTFDGIPLELSDGELVEWHVENANASVGCSFTPSSGSFTWTTGVNSVDITVVTALTAANVSDTEWPGAEDLEPWEDFPSHIFGGKQTYPIMVIDTPNYPFCKDACDEWHPE